MNIAARRLRAQRLIGQPFASAADAVAWLVAVQSQDYAGAKWALGQRVAGLTDGDVDQLFDAGEILRTHVMRPTWHFVRPNDIRWLLELTAPRVKALLAPYDRRLAIDADLLRQAYDVIQAQLRDRSYRTRDELGVALTRSGIPAVGQRLGQIVMHAELDTLVVSGPRRGKQFTYALLDERAPRGRRLERGEALVELTRRYVAGHGPALVQDLAWWSGLTVADARRGLDLVGSEIREEVIAGKSYWRATEGPSSAVADANPPVHLLPNYDEFLIAYRDRSVSLDPDCRFDLPPFPYGSILSHVVIVRGQVWGGWKRRQVGREIVVELGPLDRLESADIAALHQAAERYGAFLGRPVTLSRPEPPLPLTPSPTRGEGE